MPDSINAIVLGLRKKNADLRAKLALWETMSRPEELAEAREQANQPSLAAKQVYINAIEHYIAHLSAEYVVLSERAIHAERAKESPNA